MRLDIIFQVQLLPPQRLLIPPTRVRSCPCESRGGGIGSAHTTHWKGFSKSILTKAN